jgi:hypothetical protein
VPGEYIPPVEILRAVRPTDTYSATASGTGLDQSTPLSSTGAGVLLVVHVRTPANTANKIVIRGRKQLNFYRLPWVYVKREKDDMSRLESGAFNSLKNIYVRLIPTKPTPPNLPTPPSYLRVFRGTSLGSSIKLEASSSVKPAVSGYLKKTVTP